MKNMMLSMLAALVIATARAEEPCFVLRAKLDLDNVSTGETLLSAEGLQVSLRLAGVDPCLADYDLRSGNYLSYRRPDGLCPVVEAVIAGRAGRVGVPLSVLPPDKPVHELVLSWHPPRLAIMVDGWVDEEFACQRTDIAWKGDRRIRVYSKRLREYVMDADRSDPVPRVDVGCISRPIQYWTPGHHNAFVGDVAPAFFGGKLHVFYLIDRRHHRSGGGTGRHQFAHLVSADLRHWEQLPLAVPIREWWQTCGTGTPFAKDGHLALAFGWHSDRFGDAAKGKPLGGTYATSLDGVNFVNAPEMISDAQNPSIYTRADGTYELVTSYGGSIGIYRSTDLHDWKLFDAKLPFRGDCPSLFDWHGHRYLLQGFTNFAYSPDGSPGSFVNWTAEPDVLYEGLGVPMVVPWHGDRRLYVGWLGHLHGWGGWLVFREVVYYPDGHLGLKWVPEIETPVAPVVFSAGPGEPFALRYEPAGGGVPIVLKVDPGEKEATWHDDLPNPVFNRAPNVLIGGVRGLDAAYAVKVIAYYDAKSDATVFDAEIAGQRTLITRRPGRYLRVGK